MIGSGMFLQRVHASSGHLSRAQRLVIFGVRAGGGPLYPAATPRHSGSGQREMQYCEDIEPSKENIKPLPQGRGRAALTNASAGASAGHASAHPTALQFEQEIRAYNGPDPLSGRFAWPIQSHIASVLSRVRIQSGAGISSGRKRHSCRAETVPT